MTTPQENFPQEEQKQNESEVPKGILKQEEEEEQKEEQSSNELHEQQQQEEGGQNNESQQQQQQQPKKYKYIKCNYKFCKNYEDPNLLAKSFPQLASLQTPPNVDEIENALCYVIRSNNDDDVHKAIKYGIWTSVPGNNVKLSSAWEQSQQLKVDVYLFFSVVKSGQFIGVAKLKSSFQEETFSYWWQPHKFKGHFKIEWVFVKDIKQRAFEGLKNCQGDDISRSKDCTELKFETTGKKMLQIYKEAQPKPSIFEYFEYLDKKESILRNPYVMGRQNNKGNNGYNNQRNNGNNPANNANGMYYPNYYISQLPMAQMAQMGQFAQGMQYPQYTQEQLNQLQQMCYTNIYPPNSYPQYNYMMNQYFQQGKQNGNFQQQQQNQQNPQQQNNNEGANNNQYLYNNNNKKQNHNHKQRQNHNYKNQQNHHQGQTQQPLQPPKQDQAQHQPASEQASE